MASKQQIADIIAGVMDGSRNMPPMAERIRQRDEHLAKMSAKSAASEQPKQPATPGSGDFGPANYYEEKNRSGDNFTGD